MKLNKKIWVAFIAAAFLTVITVCFLMFRERTAFGGILRIEDLLEEAKAEQEIAGKEDLDVFLMNIGGIQMEDPGNSVGGDGTSASFCQSLDWEYSKIKQKTAGSEFDLAQERAISANEISLSRAQRDNELSDGRKDQDLKIKEFYSKLETKAKSGEEKQAVSDFEQAADGAILVSRAAVDKAIADHRKGLEKISDSRKMAIDQSLVDYKTGTRISFGRAKDKCSDSSDPEAVRQELLDDLENVKNGLYSENEAIRSRTVQALREERTLALQKAANDLDLSIGRARDRMMESFPCRDLDI